MKRFCFVITFLIAGKLAAQIISQTNGITYQFHRSVSYAYLFHGIQVQQKQWGHELSLDLFY